MRKFNKGLLLGVAASFMFILLAMPHSSHAAVRYAYFSASVGRFINGQWTASPNALLSIHNNTTGANGSTYSSMESNGNAYFHVTMIQGQSYTLKASKTVGCIKYYADPYTLTPTTANPQTGFTLNHQTKVC
jgi:hypothetical protein